MDVDPMNSASASLMIAVTDHVVWIRINGRANFGCSLDLKKVFHEMTERGYRTFILDLTECLLMDSTFLGMLAGIGLKCNESGGDGSSLELLNPNSRIRDVLENLGVVHLFKLLEAPRLEEGNYQSMRREPGPSKEELTRNSLEAHRTLMEIHPDNVPRFKDVTRFLAEDLKKIERQKPA